MAAPTLRDYVESVWSDQVSAGTEASTAALDWTTSGDLILVLGATENNDQTLATPTATGLTFSAMSGTPTNTSNSCKAYAWSATASGSGSSTVSSTSGGGTSQRGLSAWAFGDSSGLGTPVVNVGTGRTVSMTVAGPDSTVVMVLADWTATSDVAFTSTPSGATVREAVNGTGATFLVLEWTNQAAGTRNYGVNTDWTGTGTISKVAVEVKGTAVTAFDGTASLASTVNLTASGQVGKVGTSTLDLSVALTAVGDTTAFETVFTSQTPSSPNVNDSQSITLGTWVKSSLSGQIHGIRWFAPTTAPSSAPIGVLYSRLGAELARATFPTIAAGQWNSAMFSSPVSITSETYYLAAVWTPDRYVATGGFFNTGGAGASGITNGHLHAPVTGGATSVYSSGNGLFIQPSGTDAALPNTSFNGGNYFADVLLTVTEPSASASLSAGVTITATGQSSAGNGTAPLAVGVAITAAGSVTSGGSLSRSAALALSTSIEAGYEFAASLPSPSAFAYSVAFTAAGSVGKSSSASLAMSAGITAVQSAGAPAAGASLALAAGITAVGRADAGGTASMTNAVAFTAAGYIASGAGTQIRWLRINGAWVQVPPV